MHQYYQWRNAILIPELEVNQEFGIRRITECLRLEKTFVGHLVQAPCPEYDIKAEVLIHGQYTRQKQTLTKPIQALPH